uniref:Uncharacterized protein n=1 Tax=Sphaerodactylus townsendi TaxID=933632 RepID=A0ACB8FN97_9SAUR
MEQIAAGLTEFCGLAYETESSPQLGLVTLQREDRSQRQHHSRWKSEGAHFVAAASYPPIAEPNSGRRLAWWLRCLRSSEALVQQECKQKLASGVVHEEGRQHAGPPAVSRVSLMDRLEEDDSCHPARLPPPSPRPHPTLVEVGRQSPEGLGQRQESASSGRSMKEMWESAGGLAGLPSLFAHGSTRSCCT